ncbi:MAG TPA: peptide MFS transporter [Sphingomonas sp.]
MAIPDADATFEPASDHLDRSDGDTWFGHPRQLARLFSVELWERFGFYGLRTILVLYLTKHFLFDDHIASGLFGGYMSLVYLTPMIGGLLADRYLGSKRSVKFGALLMAAGYFMMCFGGPQGTPFVDYGGQRHDVVERKAGDVTRQYVVEAGQRLELRGQADGSVRLVADDGHVARTIASEDFRAGGRRSEIAVVVTLLALSLVVVGNGFFKPNISTVVGTLYEDGDRRRDAGFTLFYMGINLGSTGGQFLCPILADAIGWWAAFFLVGCGMVISYLLMRFDGGRLAGYGDPPPGVARSRAPLIYVASILAVPLVWLMLRNVMTAGDTPPGEGFVGYLLAMPILGRVLFVSFLAAVIGIPAWAWFQGSRAEFRMMTAAIVLIVFNVAFWTLSEQAGSSLTLFTDRNTDLTLFGLPVSTGQVQNVNSITIVLFAPIVGWIWLALAKRGWEPSIPVKFGLALVSIGMSFVLLVWGAHFVGPDFRISLWWMVLSYFIASIAELLISPVGLSMITKLSIARVVGLMMGVWFLSFSVAEYLAGAIAQATSVQTVGGQVTNMRLSLDTYLASFWTYGLWTVAIGVLLLCLTPLIRRLMHGVD